MGFLAKTVTVMLLVMSLLSIWIFIDRFLLFRSSKKQSLQFVTKVGNLLKQGKLDECINLAKQFKNGHLPKVFSAALLEFKANSSDGGYNVIEAAKRSIERATAKTDSDMKKGLSTLATIGATAPFVGLFGTVIGIINAFKGMATTGSGGIGAVAGGIAEALVTTAFGLFVAIPAVWFYNYFQNKTDLLGIEMANASSELVDHFIKATGIEEK
jgi:biopolymer transport protein ExbB/biopolymer transport protein TolQ